MTDSQRMPLIATRYVRPHGRRESIYVHVQQSTAELARELDAAVSLEEVPALNQFFVFLDVGFRLDDDEGEDPDELTEIVRLNGTDPRELLDLALGRLLQKAVEMKKTRPVFT